MNPPKKTRSRTGCFTCRKRKKKCDETSYPICQNCYTKGLNCFWPPLTHELHKKVQQVKYIDEKKPQEQEQGQGQGQGRGQEQELEEEEEYKSLDEEAEIITEKIEVARVSSDKILKPWSITNKHKYFLQRIAMQQDIVDDQGEQQEKEKEKQQENQRVIFDNLLGDGLGSFIDDSFLESFRQSE